MKNFNRKNHKGFTIIEIMVVLTILAILLPAAYRLYHEGLKKGFTRMDSKAERLRSMRVLAGQLQLDFRHAEASIDSMGDLKADNNSIILLVKTPGERNSFLNNLKSGSKDGRDRMIVIYNLNSSGELVRQVLKGELIESDMVESTSGRSSIFKQIKTRNNKSYLFIAVSSTSTSFIDNIADLEFEYKPGSTDGRDRVITTIVTNYGKIRPGPETVRQWIFSIG